MTARVIGPTAVLIAWCQCAFALNPALDVSQYTHASWLISDGFSPGRINAIAQTLDGYLWLATDAGLLRFDGVKTTPWGQVTDQRLPSDVVQALAVTSDGTLWIGTDRGLASWNGHTLVANERLKNGYINQLIAGRDGTVWATNANLTIRRSTLCEIRPAAVTCYGEDGGPGVDAFGLHESRNGTLWVGTFDGVWRWNPGKPTFYPIAHDPNG